MNEYFLQYIWRYNLFNKIEFTTNNEPIEIISVGQLNTDSGPDFFNAKIKIGTTIWVGNVEIHIKSSDWERHNHQTDNAYNNVVLHVVSDYDKDICDSKDRIIPTVILKYDKEIELRYIQLLESKYKIKCESVINKVDAFTISSWQNALTIERLNIKSDIILEKLKQNKYNWEETFYQSVFKYLGMGTNSEPFEMLARSINLNVLAKHKNNLLSIEALLFGQAGFLEENIIDDDYFNLLKREFKILQAKYSLTPIDKYLWKFMRLHPKNFPNIRIAQASNLINNSTHLFSKIIETQSVTEIAKYFSLATSDYWKTHYVFNKPSEFKVKKIGKSTIDVLIINVVVPFLFVYGKNKNLPEYIDKSIAFLEQIPPEKNSIIKYWESLNIKAKNSFDSQALIQLHNKYCIENRCLNCRIGNKILLKTI